jgi:hypothetical protein
VCANRSLYRCRSSTIPTIVVHPTIGKEVSWSHCVGQAPKISDLCNSLSANLRTATCIGILQDVGVTHHIHAVALPLKSHLMNKRISLQEIIDLQPGAGFQINILGIKQVKQALGLRLTCLQNLRMLSLLALA